MCPTSDFKKVHGILQFKLIQFFKEYNEGNLILFPQKAASGGKKKKMKRPFICELCFPLFTRFGVGGEGLFLSPVAASMHLN